MGVKLIEKMIHITLKFDVPVKVCETAAEDLGPLPDSPYMWEDYDADPDRHRVDDAARQVCVAAWSTVIELIQSWRTNGLYGDPPVPADLPPPPLPPSLLAAAVVERVTVTGPTDYEECLACQ
jgi:hypothetical protein